jgi:hypothetical protein
MGRRKLPPLFSFLANPNPTTPCLCAKERKGKTGALYLFICLSCLSGKEKAFMIQGNAIP